MTDTPTKPKALTGLPSYLLTRIAHRYNQTIHAELKTIGLSTIATRIIASLVVFKELTINELCVHALAEQPTMSRALDRLENDGIILRSVSEADNRKRVIKLTPEGEALFEKIWPVTLGANDAMLKGISAEDRAVTMRTLVKILENVRVHPI
ncbi:MarR family winged helix-turn-helix transcriptional regulator [Sulfitobacter aestuariivivens]|uniref:Winged helix-turn-helix transcriptional regulator n=1 Tax=Sulfitobacter aestuariivivens TaxID=2766981 RepID=A0A927D847_9RHOB|nr:MarR family winged helix-turn-helix transcriptional regulator [Sulfitobacter aestuariivivens]MBD3665327.1 winged helix-turn-helix transcriptional regulator [Sulfitobacter aestuariivivens]